MLRLPATVRVFLCLETTDTRRSFDGLTGMVAGVLHEDPLSGHMFVFRNKNGDRLKVLYRDRDGLVIFYKRLHEIEPWAHLKDVLERIAGLKTPEDVEPLLPDRWRAAHPQHHLSMSR